MFVTPQNTKFLHVWIHKEIIITEHKTNNIVKSTVYFDKYSQSILHSKKVSRNKMYTILADK